MDYSQLVLGKSYITTREFIPWGWGKRQLDNRTILEFTGLSHSGYFEDFLAKSGPFEGETVGLQPDEIQNLQEVAQPAMV